MVVKVEMEILLLAAEAAVRLVAEATAVVTVLTLE